MNFPHGFKAKANRISLRLRTDMNLKPLDPVDPISVANRRWLKVISLDELCEEIPVETSHLLTTDPSAFSAFTLPTETGNVIVYNSVHSPGRTASSICHEIAHNILGHQPGRILNGDGCRNFDRQMEAEADWLSGIILIPDKAAHHIVAKNLQTEACEMYGVTEDMLRFRINVSGAIARNKNRRRVR
jgi:Zn-dependent peptidase ImmA (M78 family)